MLDILLFDPWKINADLHCHSNISDGRLEPEAVVQRAKSFGVQVLALTDHDELKGIARAQSEAQRLDLLFVPGVEVSVTWAGSTIHIVGLNVDPLCTTLLDNLHKVRSGRSARALEMAQKLATLGIPNAFEGSLKFVGNPDLISRTHFARFLVDAGYCENIFQVFDKYLGEGKAAYVQQDWAKLADAVSWINAAGGTPVVAHPARYKFNDVKMWAFFQEFKDAGGKAIEVISGSHTKADYARYANYANEFGFLGSRGSDFHAPLETHIELGSVPLLPDTVKPVWHDWPAVVERFAQIV
jgi:3',5'-nucleoside bisphosphate phosphatase